MLSIRKAHRSFENAGSRQITPAPTTAPERHQTDHAKLPVLHGAAAFSTRPTLASIWRSFLAPVSGVMMGAAALMLPGAAVAQQSAFTAGSCRSEANDARSRGVHHLVVSFEGLASHSAGFVRRGLIAPMASRHGQTFMSKNYAYTSVQKAEDCIRDWSSSHGPELVLSVIGHSFGGGIAVPKLVREIADLEIDHVITLDPRSWTTDAEYRRTRSKELFTKAANVRAQLNFYQEGAMRGYRVLGADNTRVSGTSHTSLPSTTAVKSGVACELFRDCD